jgi:hypothetical protein
MGYCSKNHYVSGDICKLCNERIVPEKVKSKGINPVSKKRAKEAAEYTIKKKKFLEEFPTCAVFPKQTAKDIHHIRGKLGSRFLDERYWLAVSRDGHNWIHENEEEASKKGWYLSRLEKIDDTI